MTSARVIARTTRRTIWRLSWGHRARYTREHSYMSHRPTTMRSSPSRIRLPTSRAPASFSDQHLRGPLAWCSRPMGLATANGDAVNPDPTQPSEIVEFTKKGSSSPIQRRRGAGRRVRHRGGKGWPRQQPFGGDRRQRQRHDRARPERAARRLIAAGRPHAVIGPSAAADAPEHKCAHLTTRNSAISAGGRADDLDGNSRDELWGALDRFDAGLGDALSRRVFRQIRATSPDRATGRGGGAASASGAGAGPKLRHPGISAARPAPVQLGWRGAERGDRGLCHPA